MKVKCPNCGQTNTEEQLDHWNGTNEEGEEYCEYMLDCSECNARLYEGNEWGHWQDNELMDIYEEIEKYFRTDQ